MYFYQILQICQAADDPQLPILLQPNLAGIKPNPAGIKPNSDGIKPIQLVY